MFEWVPIPKYSGYYANKEGQIYSSASKKILKQRVKTTRNGKQYFMLGIRKDNKQHTFDVHRLIMAAFYGWASSGIYVNHKDDDGLNNNLNNLEYVSPRENSSHGRRASKGYTGVTKRGKKYQAQIHAEGRQQYLGMYSTPEEASKAYQNKLKEINEVNKYAKTINAE